MKRAKKKKKKNKKGEPDGNVWMFNHITDIFPKL